MSSLRFRYIFFCLLSLAVTLVLAYGVVDVPDPLWAEIAIMAGVVMVLSFFVGRHSENEDETAGIVSMDDDD